MRSALPAAPPRTRVRAVTCLFRTMASVLAVGAAACTATAPNQAETWGSDQANLSITGTSATLLILASGGCYGSYGGFDQRLPTGAFSIPGTYTQLIGAYPGKVQYAAQFSGTVESQQISLTVTVPALQAAVGPFTLARGVSETWSACAYP
jgi:hypothetical protein